MRTRALENHGNRKSPFARPLDLYYPEKDFKNELYST